MSINEQHPMADECFTYVGELAKCEHRHQGRQARHGGRTVKTLRCARVKVVITDGPFAETKELLGGIGPMDSRELQPAS